MEVSLEILQKEASRAEDIIGEFSKHLKNKQ